MDVDKFQKDESGLTEEQQPVENRAPPSMDPEHVCAVSFMLG